MDKQRKQDWLTALRSGKYQQGYEKLAISDDDKTRLSYCCIGVLCDISPDLGSWNGSTFIIDDIWLDGDLGGSNWRFGLSAEDERTLIQMNDGYAGGSSGPQVRRHTFAEIADWIELHVEEKP